MTLRVGPRTSIFLLLAPNFPSNSHHHGGHKELSTTEIQAMGTKEPVDLRTTLKQMATIPINHRTPDPELPAAVAAAVRLLPSLSELLAIWWQHCSTIAPNFDAPPPFGFGKKNVPQSPKYNFLPPRGGFSELRFCKGLTFRTNNFNKATSPCNYTFHV